ncbi:MAG: cyclase family protein [Terriglobus roseus]|nr:cyclase family protein [Terriglobus roseus]
MTFKEGGAPGSGFDDEVEFNTQCSSQWDSLVHYHHQPTGLAYNGASLTPADLAQESSEQGTDTPSVPTLENWHARGGLVARGVLVDYKRWADAQGIKYNPFDSHRVTTAELEKVAAAQDVQFWPGDVIIVRTGFTDALGSKNADEQAAAMSSHRTCGMEGTEASARWFWNKRFSAVAGDAIAFEAIPPVVDGKEGGIDGLVLHQYFLSLFGMHIGELWDLKALAEKCASSGRYSFLLTSSPLNVPGLVGSPPNALAIF